jgi:hypothetical protein
MARISFAYHANLAESRSGPMPPLLAITVSLWIEATPQQRHREP